MIIMVCMKAAQSAHIASCLFLKNKAGSGGGAQLYGSTKDSEPENVGAGKPLHT